MPPLTRWLEVCVAVLSPRTRKVRRRPAGRTAEMTMGMQRFEVGAIASPAERAAKDSPVEFPLGPHVPVANGLFDPRHEKDSCGVGFIADIKGRKSHKIVEDALAILCNLEHRGAVGADPRAGDGAGILVQTPHKFFARVAKD